MAKTGLYKIFGIPWPLFAALAAAVGAGVFLGRLPAGMIGALPLMIVIGALLNELGERTPFVNSFIGGGPIVVIFGSAAIVLFGLLPERAVGIVERFMGAEGFLDFYIASLIAGSILGMNRNLLIRAALRFLPAILGGVVLSLVFVGIAAHAIGYGAQRAVFFIGIPIMGGGMGAGAVPLSRIFGEALGEDPTSLLAVMVPAVVLGNILSIVAAGLLDRLGKIKKSLSGEGRLIRDSANTSADFKESPEYVKERDTTDIGKLGTGILVSSSFFVFGAVLARFAPGIHGYAWMILSVALVKCLGVLPQSIETACFQWYQFVVKNLTPALLVGIGVVYTDLGQVIETFSLTYFILVFVTVIGAIIGSALVGRLVGFYVIESTLCAGLCMVSMGGTGDVAVLSASKRMHMMPFAQISSRIGGAFMLILASLLLRVFT